MNENQNNQGGEQGGSGKIKKNYDAAIEKLKSVLRDDKIKLPTTVSNDAISELVSELFEEENKLVYAQFKTQLRDLLKQHLQMGKDIAAKKKELETLETKKQKEFTEACNALFGKIENIGELTKGYAQSLKAGLQTETTGE